MRCTFSLFLSANIFKKKGEATMIKRTSATTAGYGTSTFWSVLAAVAAYKALKETSSAWTLAAIALFLKSRKFVGGSLQRKRLSSAHVKEANGKQAFADLPMVGKTYYVLDGPPKGKLVVFCHGFSGSSHAFAAMSEFLISEGYRTLRFDLCGRGASEAPDPSKAPHTVGLFVSQLSSLIQHLDLGNEAFHLIGWSMGGAIVANFSYHFLTSSTSCA